MIHLVRAVRGVAAPRDDAKSVRSTHAAAALSIGAIIG
jgi:hypothetical protein